MTPLKDNSGNWCVILVITLMIVAIAVPNLLIRKIATDEAHASDSTRPSSLVAIGGTSGYQITWSNPAPDFGSEGALICTNTNLINTCWSAVPSSVPGSSSSQNAGD
jgi:hypothetical protein